MKHVPTDDKIYGKLTHQLSKQQYRAIINKFNIGVMLKIVVNKTRRPITERNILTNNTDTIDVTGIR